MAEVLNEMPKITREGGGRTGSKYPLDEWFDGQTRGLVEGEDYNDGKELTAKRGSVINMLHTRAKARGLKVHTVKTDYGFALRAYVPESGESVESDNGVGVDVKDVDEE